MKKRTKLYCLFGVVACVAILLLVANRSRQTPLATDWHMGEFIITNTSDTPVHHVRLEVTRDMDGKSFDHFLVTLGAHESKSFHWNEQYTPARGGRVVVTWHGHRGNVVHKIGK